MDRSRCAEYPTSAAPSNGVVRMWVVCFLLAPAALGAEEEAVVKKAPLVQVRSMQDGTEQPVRFCVPRAAKPDGPGKPVPLLVYMHSWSASCHKSEAMAETLQGCIDRGWVFVAPNFRGPNKRPEACASELAVQDVLDAVAYARKHARVDPRRIYVLGGSGGGHMTLVMAHRAPDLWAAVSAWVPITNLFDWHRFCKAKDYRYHKMMEASCGGPPGKPATDEQYRYRSPIFRLADAKGLPVDVNAGLGDGHGGASVPIDHTLHAFNVLAKANGHPGQMLSDDDVRVMTAEKRIPKHLAGKWQDEPGRQHKILFRRTAGPVRVTIFDGGHRMDATTGLKWLEGHVRPRAVRPPKSSAQAPAHPGAAEGGQTMKDKLSRSHGTTPAVSRNGMVASSQPLAVKVGIEILQAGGNAIDAAVAVNAMLGLTEPMSCGIGGDLFAIVWDAKTKRLYGLNASGRSPYRANRDLFRRRGFKSIPAKSPLSWSVPGCVGGWDMLLRRFGTMGFDKVLAPAVRHGEKGFEVTPIIGRGWQAAARFKDDDARRTYAPGGRAPKVGGTFRNPNLARTYRAIVKGGRDAFYRGEIATEIIAASEAKGGLFTRYDFEDHTSTWVEPVSTTYRGYEVWELPPNGQGIAALEMLNVLEGYDLAAMGHNTVDHLHLFVEAKKLAFEDRATYYADPAFAELPIAALISKAFAKTQRAKIDLKRAALDVKPGDPKLVHGDTVYLTVVDKDRNAVSLIQSIFHGWGSGIVPGDLGFAMQNRGCLFALDDDHLNRLEPHKRPFHTIIPAMVTKAGRPWLSFGVMGGDMQPQGHVQVLCNIIDFGMNVQEAGVAPRCRHNGSSTPTGQRMTRGGTVHLERGIPPEVANALKARGHHLASPTTHYGGYQAIRIDVKKGSLHGGSEPRKDGLAMGY